MNISEQFFKDHDLYCWKDNSKLLSNTISFDKINNSIKKIQKSPKHSMHQTLISKFWQFFISNSFIRRGENIYPRFQK